MMIPDLDLDAAGKPRALIRFVDLDALSGHAVAEMAGVGVGRAPVMVGLARRRPPDEAAPLLEELACTLVASPEPFLPITCVAVEDLARSAGLLRATAETSPYATIALTQLLGLTERASVPDGLVAESFAYSMLQAGPEFHIWRAGTRRREVSRTPQPVLLRRDGPILHVTLNRPQRHNAFSSDTRDGIIEAMHLAEMDQSIRQVELSGNGPSFCSGGDLDEFGTTPNVAAAHLIRLRQSAGYAVYSVAGRVRAVLHGACIGAGIEVPAFAGRVEATQDARFELPELRMGLIPGAGGTVSIARRIGRWRTAYLAMSGESVGLATALSWGLVDAPA
jgi:hypothetical protein